MNKVNERARATDPKYVGVIDDLFREYYLEILDNKNELGPESWEKFHKSKKSTFEGKSALKNKLKEMKSAVNTITNEMIESWYDFFLYKQTFYGKHQEFLIMKHFEELGKKVEIIRSNISENKIDLIVEGVSCQVKPYDSRNPSRNRPLDNDITYIYYKKEKKGIDFYWDSAELDNLNKKEGEENENENKN
ncbi:MAG TPA: MjaI family restriction endonuclease [Erysipelotrichaceae bacterium]|nr:MjaI family restriction endonuclease [Erysipelotrichaceae bacterium]HQA85919.1 MjaI family restriction endonuclease [Erysipelotrichaceae bacterium]